MHKYLIIIIVFLISLSCSAQKISVMSFNIRYDNHNDGINRWDERKSKLANFIKEKDPDIVGVQEALNNQVSYLQIVMNAYDYCGVGRDDGKTKGEYSAIFYKREKFKLIKTNTFWLSDTPEEISVGWDASMERICTMALLEEIKTGKQFYVFNTHFDHRGEEARIESANLIIKKEQEINTGKLPVIVTGDLNSLPESRPIKNLNSVYKDAFLQNSDEVDLFSTYNGFSSETKAKRIDYIFYSGLKLIYFNQFEVEYENGKYLSDHNPVFAKFKL